MNADDARHKLMIEAIERFNGLYCIDFGREIVAVKARLAVERMQLGFVFLGRIKTLNAIGERAVVCVGRDRHRNKEEERILFPVKRDCWPSLKLVERLVEHVDGCLTFLRQFRRFVVEFAKNNLVSRQTGRNCKTRSFCEKLVSRLPRAFCVFSLQMTSLFAAKRIFVDGKP